MIGHLRYACDTVFRFFLPDICPACHSRPPSPVSGFCDVCSRDIRSFPGPRCKGCGATLDSILELCGECLALGGRPWEHAVSVFTYGGYVRELVHRFKYNGDTCLAAVFGRHMRAPWESFGVAKPDLIVPVPAHWWRETVRGYNQSALLAKQVARSWAIPVRPLLRRRRWTRKQAMLGVEQRRRNMKNVFMARRNADLTGTRILLIDDVMTTGATLESATAALIDAGADNITVMTLARG
ncbi:MAG: ComF family protein [Candidatus Pacebacteria bacterium]|nr:ComF family protein [Candidatus Paceibacterota bacterium]